MVHHFWARFLLVKDKVKDCRDEDAISAFRNNCTDEGILNESTNVGVKTGGSRVGGPELCV